MITLSELATETDIDVILLLNKHRIADAAVRDIETGSDELSEMGDLEIE